MDTVLVVVITAIALTISAVIDPQKTILALRRALKRFGSLLPSFLTMLAFVSLVLALVPQAAIVYYLGQGRLVEASGIAAVLGSISLMPGFVAFPLAGILAQNGVAKMVVAAFTTTLMMVGVLTYPIEKQYFGAKVTIVRNLLSLAVAMLVSVAIGVYFGEIGL